MSTLRDFIPNAEFFEETKEWEKAEEIYTQGIKALNHWRLYGARANAIIMVNNLKTFKNLNDIGKTVILYL